MTPFFSAVQPFNRLCVLCALCGSGPCRPCSDPVEKAFATFPVQSLAESRARKSAPSRGTKLPFTDPTPRREMIGMAIREFVDDRHVEWKVWCVTPEQMRPVHAREMFHGRYVDYQEGWLVFESAAERRRLAPFPGKWAELSDEELGTLLRGAQVVPTRLADERQSGIYPRE